MNKPPDGSRWRIIRPKIVKPEEVEKIPEGYLRAGSLLIPLAKAQEGKRLLKAGELTNEEQKKLKEEIHPFEEWSEVAPSGRSSVIAARQPKQDTPHSEDPFWQFQERFMKHLGAIVPEALRSWSPTLITRVLTEPQTEDYIKMMCFEVESARGRDPGEEMLNAWTRFMRTFSSSLDLNPELRSRLFRIGFLLHKFGSVKTRRTSNNPHLQADWTRRIESPECIEFCIDEIRRAKTDRNRIRGSDYANAIGILRLCNLLPGKKIEILQSFSEIPDMANDLAERLLGEAKHGQIKPYDKTDSAERERIASALASIEGSIVRNDALLKKVSNLSSKKLSDSLSNADGLAAIALGIPPSRNIILNTKIGLEIEGMSSFKPGELSEGVLKKLGELNARGKPVWSAFYSDKDRGGVHADAGMTEIITPDPGVLMSRELFDAWVATSDIFHTDTMMFFLAANHINIDTLWKDDRWNLGGHGPESLLELKKVNTGPGKRDEANVPAPRFNENVPYIGDFNRICDQVVIAAFLHAVEKKKGDVCVDRLVDELITNQQERGHFEKPYFEMFKHAKRTEVQVIARLASDAGMLEELMPALLRLYAKDALPQTKILSSIEEKLRRIDYSRWGDLFISAIRNKEIPRLSVSRIFRYFKGGSYLSGTQTWPAITDESVDIAVREDLADLSIFEFSRVKEFIFGAAPLELRDIVSRRMYAPLDWSENIRSLLSIREDNKSERDDNDRIRARVAGLLRRVPWTSSVRDFVTDIEVSSTIRNEVLNALANIPWRDDVSEFLSDPLIKESTRERVAFRVKPQTDSEAENIEELIMSGSLPPYIKGTLKERVRIYREQLN